MTENDVRFADDNGCLRPNELCREYVLCHRCCWVVLELRHKNQVVTRGAEDSKAALPALQVSARSPVTSADCLPILVFRLTVLSSLHAKKMVLFVFVLFFV